MTSTIEKLATEIASLSEGEQQALLERVAELNFRRGLTALSERVRERLRREKELARSVEEILAGLSQKREEIAAHEYPGGTGFVEPALPAGNRELTFPKTYRC